VHVIILHYYQAHSDRPTGTHPPTNPRTTHRSLIGPAMYFGLMGEGQPIGRYDDMWAGWCSKVSEGVRVRLCECGREGGKEGLRSRVHERRPRGYT
jgi:hypothetical protein